MNFRVRTKVRIRVSNKVLLIMNFRVRTEVRIRVCNKALTIMNFRVRTKVQLRVCNKVELSTAALIIMKLRVLRPAETADQGRTSGM